MEKYGVVTGRTDQKTASPLDRCPLCGSALDPTSSVPKCPVHGTEPFEEQKKEEGNGSR